MSSEPSAPGARPSHRVGKYEVIRHIATGGMGAVYQARDTERGREVALKVLPPGLAAKPILLERFRREARSAAKLRHENIVRIYECGEAGGVYYLALEYVDGVDLQEYINRKGRLPPEEARYIVVQAARALNHAFRRGIIHRDIKPSNFLITTKDGRPVVKLTDMGLARHVQEDEFRITRDGTTVGTIDYMSPEQARDSSKADIRSDIYSLGCTLYHMLAGQPPFAEGSLTERMYKHIETEPEDVRKFNPRVPPPLVTILRRMLKKRPADRYQTPRDLLHDLKHPDEVPDPDQQPPRPAAATPAAAPKRPSSTSEARPRKAPPSRSEQDTKERRLRKTRKMAAARGGWGWVIAGAGLLAVALGFAAWAAFGSNGSEGDDQAGQAPATRPGQRQTGGGLPAPLPGPTTRPQETRYRALYQPRVPLDPDQLRREFRAPDQPAPAADARRVVVRRGASGRPDTFGSLAEACRAARDRDVVIEVQDNGPLFVPSVAVAGHRLVVRAARGYRPLIAWDVGLKANAPSPNVLLAVERGGLTLEGLDVVVWNDWRDAREPAALFQVAGGSFAARDCTFSTSGRHPHGVALVRLAASAGAGAPAENDNPKPAVLLSRCYARGADLSALVLQAPAADVRIDRSLLVGGEPPLLQVTAGAGTPTELRVFRSTLVSGRTLLRVGAGQGEAKPALHWSAWDALLAQSNPQVDGNLMEVPAEVSTEAMSWHAVNCLYAGWKRLLAGRENIGDLDAWHKHWRQDEGDQVLGPTWPKDAPADPEETSPAQYRVAKTDAAYAATSGPGTLGCDVDALLAARPSWLPTHKAWLVFTYRRYPAAPPPLPDDDAPPDVEPVDLSQVPDLAALVRQQAQGLAPGSRLVLRLTGQGPCPTSPIRLKGISLVLYFDTPQARGRSVKARPLELVPLRDTAADREALIEVEDGSLEAVGARIRFPNSRLAPLPRRMLQVTNGDLRLFRCRLDGPLTEAPESYRGLIRLAGSGKTDPEKTPAVAVNQSVLVTGRTAAEVAGTGARLALSQSLVAAEVAVDLQPGASARPPLAVQCFLDRNTLALTGTLLHLGDAPRLAGPVEPMIVQADNNLCLAPFAGTAGRPALLRFEGDALPRGLLLWQGTGNGLDAGRLDSLPGAPAAAWVSLWGTRGAAGARLQDLAKTRLSSLSLAKPALERLLLPPSLRPRSGQPPLGADLKALGIGKKTP